MEKDDLIKKINSGSYSKEDLSRVEQLIMAGELDPMELNLVTEMTTEIDSMEFPEPGLKLEEGFYAKLREEKSRVKGRFRFPQLSLSLLKTNWGLALYTTLMLFVVFSLSYNNRQNSIEMVNEMRNMKELMLLSLIDEESTSERLKAVNMSADLDQASEKVITALFQTLNNDPNTNVRLAAMEALLVYSYQPDVRLGLVNSISKQDSPMMLISLAEVMAGLQEKESIENLRKLLQREDTPSEVREKVQETIESLI